MSETAPLATRLQDIAYRLRNDPELLGATIQIDRDETHLLIEALARPEVRHSCASTTNYSVMAERALRLIARNGIADGEAIEMVTHLVDCAGIDYAKDAVEVDDAVPF